MQLTFSSLSEFLDQTISASVGPTPILYWDKEPNNVHVAKLSESAKSLSQQRPISSISTKWMIPDPH